MKKIRLLTYALLVTLLAGCNSNNNESLSSEAISSSNSEENSEESVSSSVVVESSSEEVDNEYGPLVNWDEISLQCSQAGDLLDVTVGREFMTGGTYDIVYSLYGLQSDPNNEKVVSSNEKVFSLEKIGANYKLTCHHAGQAYIRIIDSNDIVRYCALVTVLDPIPLENMEEYLVYDCEYWVSAMAWSDSFTLIFNENGQYTISGHLSNASFGSITGTYEYSETINNGKEYAYVFTDNEVKQQVGLTGFHVATTGRFMYLQDTYGTAAIMLPNDQINQGE